MLYSRGCTLLVQYNSYNYVSTFNFIKCALTSELVGFPFRRSKGELTGDVYRPALGQRSETISVCCEI